MYSLLAYSFDQICVRYYHIYLICCEPTTSILKLIGSMSTASIFTLSVLRPLLAHSFDHVTHVLPTSDDAQFVATWDFTSFFLSSNNTPFLQHRVKHNLFEHRTVYHFPVSIIHQFHQHQIIYIFL